jgi:hypothetical protein
MAYDITKEDVLNKIIDAEALVREGFSTVSQIFWQASQVGSHKASKEWGGYRTQLNNISKAIFDLKKDLRA